MKTKVTHINLTEQMIVKNNREKTKNVFTV